MIWYSLEALFVLFMLFVAFFVYRTLVHSKRFARFVNRTVDVGDEIDVETKIDRAEEDAERFVDETREEVKRKARAARNVRNRLS
jgi:DNA-binding transcriptional regulator GbsR (MarR family)